MFVLFGLIVKPFILIILSSVVMKVVFDYTTYFCLLNFLTTLSGLTLQKGWRDLGDNYVTTVFLSTHVLSQKGRLVSILQKECLQLGLAL